MRKCQYLFKRFRKFIRTQQNIFSVFTNVMHKLFHMQNVDNVDNLVDNSNLRKNRGILIVDNFYIN